MVGTHLQVCHMAGMQLLTHAGMNTLARLHKMPPCQGVVRWLGGGGTTVNALQCRKKPKQHLLGLRAALAAARYLHGDGPAPHWRANGQVPLAWLVRGEQDEVVPDCALTDLLLGEGRGAVEVVTGSVPDVLGAQPPALLHIERLCDTAAADDSVDVGLE